ncbi:MAG TPA: hypothetical protein VKN82_10295 [Desulfohalobiaceae bacterium]|nr:hypothetical protein [Desulfohalobiaceae bacterium]
MDKAEIEDLQQYIDKIQQAADTLIAKAQGIQSIERNADRILASTYMLKMNISDLLFE